MAPKIKDPKVVVVTGCDSGIGQLTAAAAHRKGYHVFAGCLTDAGVAAVAAEAAGSARLVGLRLDVTSLESIAAFAAAVKAQSPTPHLHAVVNNAGVFACGFVDWLSDATYRKVMDVNFFGTVNVTKAFLPALMLARDDGRRGRVIIMSSAAGIVAGPAWSAYHSSKFAVEGWADSLRREIGHHGVSISLMEPSFLRTPMVADPARYIQATWDAAPADAQARWGAEFKDEFAAKQAEAAKAAADPQLCVDCILHALRARHPRRRYRPNWAAKTFFYFLSLLPASWVDALSAADTATKAKPRWTLPAGPKKAA